MPAPENFKRVKCDFLLPCNDNDGTDLTDEINQLLSDIFPEFQWTFTGYTKGVWESAGKQIMVDTCQMYFVITSEDKIPLLEKRLMEFKDKTTQEALIVVIHRDIEVKFI